MHHSARAVQVLDRLATSPDSRCALACMPPRGSACNEVVRVMLLLQHVRHADAEQDLSTVPPPAAPQVRCWWVSLITQQLLRVPHRFSAACKTCWTSIDSDMESGTW